MENQQVVMVSGGIVNILSWDQATLLPIQQVVMGWRAPSRPTPAPHRPDLARISSASVIVRDSVDSGALTRGTAAEGAYILGASFLVLLF